MMLGMLSKNLPSRAALKRRGLNKLEKKHDFGWRSAFSAAKNVFFSLAALAAKITRLDFVRNLFPSCRRNSKFRLLPWKSGPLGPRQPLRLGAGFGPLIAMIFVTSLLISQTQPALPKADTIYIHGNIYTGTAGASSFHEAQRAEAMAIKGDRILLIGKESDVLT